MAGGSRVESVHEGKTFVIVQDAHNEFNTDKILVEVEQVAHLAWLETRVEALQKMDSSLLSVIALDS